MPGSRGLTAQTPAECEVDQRNSCRDHKKHTGMPLKLDAFKDLIEWCAKCRKKGFSLLIKHQITTVMSRYLLYFKVNTLQ